MSAAPPSDHPATVGTSAARFKICDTAVWIDDGSISRNIPKQRGLLLRLLLLWKEESVPRSLICLVLNIKSAGYGNYIKLLRGDLGAQAAAILESKEGHARLILGDSTVDAYDFRKLLENVEKFDHADLGQVSQDALREARLILDKALTLWHGSPATGIREAIESRRLPAHSQAERNFLLELEAISDEWLNWYQKARMMRNRFRIALSTPQDVGDAIVDLMNMAKLDPADYVWEPLFKACQLNADRQRLKVAWQLCQRYFADSDEEPPTALRDIVYPTATSTSTPPAFLNPSRERAVEVDGPRDLVLPAALDHRLPLVDMLGITTASAVRLRGSEIEPEDCIERTRKLLYFKGVLASKWVIEPAIRASFESLLRRLDTDDEPGDVRFLIINPKGNAFERLYQLRGGGISTESVQHLRRLASRYQCFEVRAFDTLPAFRIIVIDDEVVSFSFYTMEEEAYKTTRRGWDVPHVILDPRAPWPLATAFRMQFEESWNSAVPLDKI